MNSRKLAEVPGLARTVGRRDPPLVSVIVLSYNHASFIVETLDSVRAQTYPRTELIVIDDASKDDSVSRVRAWEGSRGAPLHLIQNPTNLGICRSLNRALAGATGDFVAIVASDDRWLPGKLEAQVAEAERRGPTTGLVYGDAYCIDERGIRLPERFIQHYRPAGPPADGEVFSALQEGNFIPAPATLVRRSCYEAVGRYDEALCYEDWDMWLRIAHRYGVAYCDFVSAEYRRLPNSMAQRLLRGAPAAMETTARIARKWRKAGGVDERHRLIWTQRIIHAAESLFEVRHAASASVLWWAILATRGSQRSVLIKKLARCLWARSRGRFVPIDY